MATENNYNNQDGMIVSSLVKDIKLWKRQDEINSELVDAVKRAGSSCAYLICTTPGDISEKSIELPNFTVSTNIRFLVRMMYAHTNEETTPTLNINETGEIGITYNGKEASYLNTWEDDEILDLYYNGETYIATPHLDVDDVPTEYSKNLVRSGGIRRELTNINLDIHGVEPGDYLLPDSVFIPEGEPGITSESMMKEFITDFKMLIERDFNYEYGIYQVNSGIPSGLSDSFGIFLFRYPSGEEPVDDNIEGIGKFMSEEQPEDGKVYIVGAGENIAEVVVNWSSLEEPWDSTTPYAGIGLGVRYNQDYIFYHGTSIDDKLEEISGEIDSLEEDISELETSVSGLDTRVTGLNTRVTGLNTRVTELDERVTVELTNINLDIHGVEPGDYLLPDSVFIPEDEPGITSESMMKEFITDFKMLIERDRDYEYGIYQVNSGIPSGLSDSFGIFLFKYPSGEEPVDDNIDGIGKFTSEEQPKDGKVYIVGTGTGENIAEVVVNWSSLEEPWDSTTPYAGIGLGVRYNQDYIFYHGTSIDDKLEEIDGEIFLLDKDVSELNTSVSGLGTSVTELNTSVSGLGTSVTELGTRVTGLGGRITALENLNHIDICTPSVIFAVVGDTLQLYYNSMFRCVNYHNYNINITCDIGHPYPRYFEVTPESWQVGSHNLDIKVCDNNKNIIASKRVRLDVVSVSGSPENMLNVLCVGSSVTRSGMWIAEFYRRLTGTGGTPAGLELTNIKLVGRRGSGDIKYESVDGFGFREYSTESHLCIFTVSTSDLNEIRIGSVYTTGNNSFSVYELNPDGNELICSGPVVSLGSGILTKVSGVGPGTVSYHSCYTNENPFVHGMNRYKADYCDNNNIDVVYTELFGGISSNGLPSFSDNINFTAMRDFIDMCKDAFPEVKICIGLPWCPDIRGGIGLNYGTSDWGDAYGIKYTYLNLCNQLQTYIVNDGLESFVFICNWLNEFDSENNFTQIQKKKNTRMPSTADSYVLEPTEIFGNNGTQPTIYGHLQMADSAFRLFVANFCS